MMPNTLYQNTYYPEIYYVLYKHKIYYFNIQSPLRIQFEWEEANGFNEHNLPPAHLCTSEYVQQFLQSHPFPFNLNIIESPRDITDDFI